ncbi:hypothetical protein BO85DRAFT_479814 [Aspergillus piperis CBS 112811]|uniref:Tat pathway signal sequence n=1 Tax=Aspergillus piperis CBS 112811 TaxID=1448313 RepID=A0A8G1QYT5_9EURO|nr:hypothetical protein BO85DRAFT_479814 [Aspergillus piperis CBS 112811]RAH55362.1 hypothetical protein BO85DRAFT_479814 [Aspergillus piperis CBS 112811]
MKDAAYCPVDDGSDCRGSRSLDKDEARRVLLSKPFEDHVVHSSPPMSRKYLFFGLFCVVLLMLNTIMLVFNLWTTTPHSRQEGFIQKPTDYWLPGFENGIVYEKRQFYSAHSEYAGVGPEVDAKWHDLTRGAMGISRQQLTALNNHPDVAVQIENAGPDQEYLATFDVLHQLHCVDLLRKGIHMDYYKDKDEHFVNQTDERIFFHLDHCVDILRQTLMCNDDLSLVTYNWVQGLEIPYPNFNTYHTCKNWDTFFALNQKLDVSARWEGGKVVEEYPIPRKPEHVDGMWPPP